MSLFERGIYLEQHKEPAMSRRLVIAEGISFKDYDEEKYLSLKGDYIYKLMEFAKIKDEHTGSLLIDKANSALRSRTEHLVINAVDDDPYTSSSSCALFHLTSYALLGARLFAKAIGAKRISCAVNGDIDISGSLFKIPEKLYGVPVRKINGKYPQAIRLEKAFRENVTAVSSGALINLAKTIIDGEVSKICFVTVAGDCVKHSVNVAVNVGTQIKDLFEWCGLLGEPQKIIVGSMMSGRAVETTEVGVEVTTMSVIALSKYTVKTGLNCIGCGRCVLVCPQKLSPYYMYKSSKRGIEAPTLLKMAAKCTLCGCCSYICPGSCNPTHYIRLYKNKLQSLQSREE